MKNPFTEPFGEAFFFLRCLEVKAIATFLVRIYLSKSLYLFDFSVSTQYILYSVFTAVSLLGGIIFLLLPNPPEDPNEKKKIEADSPKDPWREVWEELCRGFLLIDLKRNSVKSIRMVMTFDFLLIAIPSAFTGIELSFW